MQIELLWNTKIPMRDGVHLNSVIYKPRKMETPLPVILTLTPYLSDAYHGVGSLFARSGYIFASVDCRGRGNSEGIFHPVFQEDKDGYDTVEWLAEQPWCNGKVGMVGVSYGGFDQWATVKTFPPHLKSLLPTAAGYPGLDFPHRKNIFMAYFMMWFAQTSAKVRSQNLYHDRPYWLEVFYERYKKHLPFIDLDVLSGITDTLWREWVLKFNKQGQHWDCSVPTKENYAKIDIPILTISGYYDDDQLGALQYYINHMRFGQPGAIAKHYLVLGTWDHSHTAGPVKKIGGWEFGDESVIDMMKLWLAWFDWTLKAGDKPEFLEKRVAYYQMGTEKWKYSDSLDGDNLTQRFYLSSEGGQADCVFSSGKLLTQTPQNQLPDTYLYDPLDTTVGDMESLHLLDMLQNRNIDQRYLHQLAGRGLVYHTDPFQEEVVYTGKPRLEAWIELNVPNSDFEVNLYQIFPDGRSLWLGRDILRACHRKSLREVKPVNPGEIDLYAFEDFNWISIRMSIGSRLRLVIRCLDSILWEKNYNSGGAVFLETAEDARSAHVRLYHDAKYPSCLEIPVERQHKSP